MNKAVLLLLALQAALLSCASAPPPRWVGDMEAVYPAAHFIARQGRGVTVDAAKADALGEIAAYFETEINKKETAYTKMIQQAGVVAKSKGIENTITLTVHRNLSGVLYADNPWKDPATKEFATVAYIDREAAWEIFEPRLWSVCTSFVEFFEAAGGADDPLTQYTRYRAAANLWNEAGGAKDALAYAQVLHPEKAGVGIYKTAQDDFAKVPGAIKNVLDWAIITVTCENDFENIVTGAIVDAFTKGGFKAAAGGRGTNRAAVKIAENGEKLEAGTFYAPRLTLTVYGEDRALFSWNANAARKGAWDANVAKRERWNALAAEVKASLLREFNAAMDGGMK